MNPPELHICVSVYACIYSNSVFSKGRVHSVPKMLKIGCSEDLKCLYSRPEYLSLGTIDIWGRIIVAIGAAMYIVGCLAEFLGLSMRCQESPS
jgi:hypothetical protein